MDALRKDGHIYALPGRMQLPYICGKKSDLTKMTGLSDIVDEMELIRAKLK
ncbi:MAG: hypothetical protein K2H37_14850 [Lachnospiraceae bacterium]|nr:hypothetical protein [Lachnospiraceae bacterium]